MINLFCCNLTSLKISFYTFYVDEQEVNIQDGETQEAYLPQSNPVQGNLLGVLIRKPLLMFVRIVFFQAEIRGKLFLELLSRSCLTDFDKISNCSLTADNNTP